MKNSQTNQKTGSASASASHRQPKPTEKICQDVSAAKHHCTPSQAVDATTINGVGETEANSAEQYSMIINLKTMRRRRIISSTILAILFFALLTVSNSAFALLTAPTLNGPVNGATGVSTTPTFSWSAVTGANRYWLILDTSSAALPTDPNASSCPDCVVNGISGNTTLTSYTPPASFPINGTTRTLSPNTTYYWKVQGWNTSGTQGNYSSVYSFTTAATLLPAPTLSGPANGATGVSTTPTFSWSAVTGADRYWLMLDTNPSFFPTDPNATSCSDCVVNGLSGNTGSTSYTPPTSFPYGGTTRTLSPNTTYYWKIQGYKSGGAQGNYSSIWSFTTAGAICYYSLNSYSASPGSSSGSSSFSIYAGSGCSWSASTSYSWIHTTSSGSGNGTVSYTYDANTSTSSRPGTIMAGGQTFTITQAGQSGSADYPGATWIPAADANQGIANRSFSNVRWIVIHTTEGTTASAVQRFQDPTQQASAHYIVSRDGSIIQLVHNKDISYGCGNLSYNNDCINIEHERYSTYDCTPVQYQASANLVKWLLTQYNVSTTFPSVPTGIAPADPTAGSGIIGHIQVPDPYNPSLGGGASHHTDPVNWDWSGYETLIIGTTPPAMSLNYGGTAIPNGDQSPSAAKGTDFGNIVYGFYSSARTFTINNSGSGALNLTATPRVQFSGANPSDFYMVVAAPSSPVSAGSSTTFQLVFEPTANTGLRSATVTIANDDPNKNPYTFKVQGNGVIQSNVSPSFEYNGAKSPPGDQSPTVGKGTDFGSVNVGSQSATHTFQLYNYGNINLMLTGSYVQLSGANSGDFAIVSTPSSPIAPNQYSPIGIRFQPTGSGLRMASILIYFDATYAPGITSPYTVALQGTGLAAYTINASAGSGGSISPNGSFPKNAGDSQAFTATPNTNYVVNQWLVDSGVMQTGGTSYTLNNIQAAHSVQVTFTQAISPKLGNPHRTGTTFTLSVPTQVGFNYTLEYKNALSDANWTFVQTLGGTGGTITLTDTGATGSSRLYHVRVQ